MGQRRNTTILDRLRETNVLDDETVAELEKVVDAFTLEFQGSQPATLAEARDANEVEDINQEKIVKAKR